MPQFYKPQFKNLNSRYRQEIEYMRKTINQFDKKMIVEGESKGPRNGDIGQGNKLKKNLMETIIIEKPNIKWEDVAGLEQAKASLNEAIFMPIKFPQFFVGNVQPWKGILLYGPPGTGKTFIAKACASECDATFFAVSSSDMMSKYVGESERLIKSLFELARERAPSIIFIDEIDSMCGARSEGENQSSRRVKTEFLVQMDGVKKQTGQVLILGATNTPWALDSAIRRRFERRIYIDLPDLEARAYLLRRKLKGLDQKLTDEDIDFIARKTEGFSGSDLTTLAKEAAFEPLRFA